jgi:hypothetical protein
MEMISLLEHISKKPMIRNMRRQRENWRQTMAGGGFH